MDGLLSSENTSSSAAIFREVLEPLKVQYHDGDGGSSNLDGTLSSENTYSSAAIIREVLEPLKVQYHDGDSGKPNLDGMLSSDNTSSSAAIIRAVLEPLKVQHHDGDRCRPNLDGMLSSENTNTIVLDGWGEFQSSESDSVQAEEPGEAFVDIKDNDQLNITYCQHLFLPHLSLSS